MPNVFSSDFEEQIGQKGFRCRGMAVAKAAGGERLGASVYLVPPGEATCPYHYWDGERPPEVPG